MTIVKIEGKVRTVIKAVQPEIDCGEVAIKRVVGEKVDVEADIITDGHDVISAALLYRHESESEWARVPMKFLINDRWRGSFRVASQGRYLYTIRAWINRFRSWRRDLEKKINAGQEVSIELLMGSQIMYEAVLRASELDARRMKDWADTLSSPDVSQSAKLALALNDEVAETVERYPDWQSASTYAKQLEVTVDRRKAGFSAWYEIFPRSATPEPRHGTFKDCESRLPYIAGMGFDVLYFPPIHPIGHTHRRGPNNSPQAGPHDPGSPWAIGSEEGGHKAVHPQLGTLDDFRSLVTKAGEFDVEIALDIAFQSSPDHPYVKEHPEWYLLRPDGTVQYAENPPKKYEDIYPFNFESDDWPGLWEELKSIVFFWIEQGVRIFRIDNPHTKPFRFWQWLIPEIKRTHTDVIFLSEAFTRPKVMYELAKIGFTQSYTYFTWRNTKWELTEYFKQLTRTEIREYFRPNVWPNTPDILTEYLQYGGRPAFLVRLVLAATLGANYGIYGPAFELQENRARETGSEEYLNSEKYEIREWDVDRPDSLREIIARVNRIRKQNPALHSDWSLRFHPVDNDQLLCYSKRSEDLSNAVLVVANLDPYHTQSGWVELPLEEFGLDPDQGFQMHDLLSDAYYLWHGSRNYVEVNPHVVPAHIFRLRHRIRTERDFEYYL